MQAQRADQAIGPAAMAEERPLRIAVVVASLGRPGELDQLISALESQTYPPSAVVLSVTKNDDLPPTLPAHAQVVIGSKGLTAQRNRGMTMVLDSSDLIAFFDDDYLPSRRALECAASLFNRFPDIVGADG